MVNPDAMPLDGEWTLKGYGVHFRIWSFFWILKAFPEIHWPGRGYQAALQCLASRAPFMTFPFPPDTHHKHIQGSKQEILKYQQDQKHASEVTPTILTRDVHKRSKLGLCCIFLKVNRKRKTAGNQLQITTFSWTTKNWSYRGEWVE